MTFTASEAPTLTTTPRTSHRISLPSDLTRNQQHHYADTLADALQRRKGHIPRCEPQRPQGEDPGFNTRGAHQHTRARTLQTHTNGNPTYHVPPATITIGGYEYDNAQQGLWDQDLHHAWHRWLHLGWKGSEWYPAPSLTRTEGRQILLNNTEHHAAGRAAMWILSFAWVDVFS